MTRIVLPVLLLLVGCDNSQQAAQAKANAAAVKLCETYNFGLQNHLKVGDTRLALQKLNAFSPDDWSAIDNNTPHVGMNEAAVLCAIPGQMVSFTTSTGGNDEMIFSISPYKSIAVTAHNSVVTAITTRTGE